MICDICGEELLPGDKYFSMPDGRCVCDFSFDCLQQWAKDYEYFKQEDPMRALRIKP